MTPLTEINRWRVVKGLSRYWSSVREIYNVNRAGTKAAIDAIDDWVEAKTAEFNAALPQPFRSQATSEQKALAFAVVVLCRAGEHLLRRLLNEVD